MATKEETEEQNLEQLINLLKKVKVTSSFVEKLEKEPGYLEFQQVDLRRQELLISIQAGKDEQIHSVELKRETHQTEDKQRDENVPPELNALHQILKKYKVIMPIKEMAKQSPCCIMFLQELLKKHVDLSEEEIISLTSECHLTHKVPVEVRFDGEGCFTLSIKINGEYIGQGLCNSRANCNLMSLTKAEELWIRKISPYPYAIGYANSHEEEALGVLKDFPFNIGGFDYCLDIVIADTRGIYEFPLILGRKFFA